MSPSLDHRWEMPSARPNRLGMLALRVVRDVCTPANLALCAVVALGWLALIGWTGAGATGWQARLCADLDLQPRACAVLPGAADRAGPDLARAS